MFFLLFNNASAFYSSISGERSTFHLIVHLAMNGFNETKAKENEVEENETSAHTNSVIWNWTRKKRRNDLIRSPSRFQLFINTIRFIARIS